MLDELRIRGLGVIDDAVLEFGPGLTVVTGETGAGKTMVVTGLLLLFGGRADAGRIRTGVEQASVDGRVRVPADSTVAERVRGAGGDLDAPTGDGQAELVLRRVVASTGRSRAHVGGAGAPLAVLADLGDALLAVHGQSDQVRLARPATQRAALDAYAGTDLTAYRAAFAAWRAAEDALADRLARSAELRREAAVLARGIAEIEAAAPQPDEADELARLASRLGHADALTAVARSAHDALVGAADDPIGTGADVSALVAAAARTAGQQRGADADLDVLIARLSELGVLANDLAADFGAYADALDADPERLEQIENRRSVLSSLVRTYCDEPEPSLAGVLRWADAARERLADVDVSDEAMDLLRTARADAAAAAARHAATVSAARTAAAGRLAEQVTAELHGLAMPASRFRVEVTPRPAAAGTPTLRIGDRDVAAGPDGTDDVAFTLQPHPGSPALPLGRGASGGELSRVMLAVEVCLAQPGAPTAEPTVEDTGTRRAEPVPTLVFDEVDAGVGGRAALEVGRRLARLARDRQVVVVTHLAQVAAFADRHIVVDKPRGAPDGIVASDVRPVTGADRVAELARMLAGSDSATALEHAAELLAAANPAPPAARARASRR